MAGPNDPLPSRQASIGLPNLSPPTVGTDQGGQDRHGLQGLLSRLQKLGQRPELRRESPRHASTAPQDV
eukprot:scaffold677221_cov42-Prasinocladus_malaysianus.AAC.1